MNRLLCPKRATLGSATISTLSLLLGACGETDETTADGSTTIQPGTSATGPVDTGPTPVARNPTTGTPVTPGDAPTQPNPGEIPTTPGAGGDNGVTTGGQTSVGGQSGVGGQTSTGGQTNTGGATEPVTPSNDPLLPLIENALAVSAGRLTAIAADREPGGDAFIAYTEYEGDWDHQEVDNWCSGFLPGIFWFMHELTGEATWATHAHDWGLAVGEVAGGPDNDTGFQINGAVGLGLLYATDVSNNAEYEELVLEGAASLFDQRYNPTIGGFRSWEQRLTDPFTISNEIGAENRERFEINIDMLMNMELVLMAADILEQRGGQTDRVSAYRDAVNSHFDISFRDLTRGGGDFNQGTIHVAQYSDTGALINQRTEQGAADDSTWSRGQSWAIYGHAMLYRYLGNPVMLQRAEGFASYQLAKTVDNPIPFTDYDRTAADDTRDSSAAAIACSAFMEMHEQTGEADDGVYISEARRILTALTSDEYLNGSDGQESLLWSCTERYGPNTPDGFPEVGCSFGDYYFLECMLRYRDWATQ